MNETARNREAFVRTRRNRAKTGVFVTFAMWVLIFVMYIVPQSCGNEIASLVLAPLFLITVALFMSIWLARQIYETTVWYTDEVKIEDL